MKPKLLKVSLTGLVLLVCSLFNVANAGIIKTEQIIFEQQTQGTDIFRLSEGYFGPETLTLILFQYDFEFGFEYTNNNNEIEDAKAHFTLKDTGADLSSYVGTISAQISPNESFSKTMYHSDDITLWQPDHIAAWRDGTRFDMTSMIDSLSGDAKSNGIIRAGGVITIQYIIDGEPVNVPEPSTFAIFALGMVGLASRRFKKQS